MSASSVYYTLSLLLLLPAPLLFFGWFYRMIERRAQRVIDFLPYVPEARYTDVRVWFKGYDMTKRINKFQIDPQKSLYVYNLIDLFVFKGGVVVVGKTKYFGKTFLLSPFAICWSGGEEELSMVPYRFRYLGAEILDQDVDIQFQDPDYFNSIKIEIKNLGKELFSKIDTQNQPGIGSSGY